MSILKKLVLGAVIAIAAAGVAEAKEWKKVRIGTEGAYPPFNFFDADKQLQGFDIDVAKALCEKMAVECEFVAQDWDGIIPALLANKYDAIIASMSITDERRQQVDFTNKYYSSPIAFMVQKGKIADVTAAGLTGKAVGAQSSTVSANFVEDTYKGSNVKLYPTQEEANLDLASGRLDAIAVDKLVGYEWLTSTDDGKCCEFVGEDVMDEKYVGEGIGIAIRKDDSDLRDMFNKAIEDIRGDGTYEKINAKYFPFSIF
ncbi:MAG TPA: ABC transporter substrate-binding protein [Hyphomicrobiales bacterium]|nr:ABC transporter substrate-binding protein [Hyphomicrobiales bacterium]